MKTYKLLSIALTLLIPAIILAQPGIDYFEKNHPPEHILNLSDAQKEQITDIKLDHKKTVIKLKSELKIAKIELEELIMNDESKKKIDDAVKKVTDYQSKLFKQNIDHRMKFRALLTDEQKLNLKNLKFEKKRMPMMNKRKMQSNHFHGYQGRNTRQNPNQSLKHRNK